MHDYCLACSIAEIVRDSAHKHGLVTIERVILAVGPQAAVQEDTLNFLFAEVAKAYGIGCPHLVFQHEPLQVKCGVCGETTVAELPTGGFREIWHNPEGVALPVRFPLRGNCIWPTVV